MGMDRYVRGNQELWDEWTDINVRSEFYDVAGFKANTPPLDPEVREVLGPLEGKSVLHLQCHFGMDTLRIATEAREVTGIDFSERAVGQARQLAGDLGIPARFVQSDLYDLPRVLDGQFDVVFTSYGVIGWLPDLAPWGRIIARYLAPGGRFAMVEAHPTMWMYDGEAPELRIRYPYFHVDEPVIEPPTTGNYADPTAPVTKSAYTWSHSMSDIVMSLIDAGLRIDELREHRHVVWKAFPFLVEESRHRWRMPPDRPEIPLLFSLRASRPG
ncbi:MAG: class I SAM-dependent methyltransferase [Kofleriaceae bacterium]